MALPVLWVCSPQCVCSLSRYQCASVFVYVCVCVCSAVSSCLIICSSQKPPQEGPLSQLFSGKL